MVPREQAGRNWFSPELTVPVASRDCLSWSASLMFSGTSRLLLIIYLSHEHRGWFSDSAGDGFRAGSFTRV